MQDHCPHEPRQQAAHEKNKGFFNGLLVYDATANGWLTDHGTGLHDLSKLLQNYGVDCHEGHDWRHLIHDLAAGHQVIMAVNADRLWSAHQPGAEVLNLFGNSPNHAIVVKGLTTDDHGRVTVVVNDPGQVDGGGVEYPLEHFQSAIESSHLHFVATDQAPADWSPPPAVQALAANYEANHHGDESHVGTPFDDQEPVRFSEQLTSMDDEQHESFLRDL